MRSNAFSSIVLLSVSIPAFPQQAVYSCPETIECTQIPGHNAVCQYPPGWISYVDHIWSDNAGNKTYTLAKTGDIRQIRLDIPSTPDPNSPDNVASVQCDYLPITKTVRIQIESDPNIYHNPQPYGDGWLRYDTYWGCDRSQSPCQFTFGTVK